MICLSKGIDMSKNIFQIFSTNPITSNASTDLMYFGQSPYGPTNDAAMTFANFAAQFGSVFTPSALTRVNDTNVTLTLGGTPATALLQATSITAGWAGTLSLTRGGLAASLVASNGGIFYSTASAGAILSGTATAQQLLTSGANAAPVWTTSTYPLTNPINTLLYASSANVMASLATANSSVLVTSAGGVPSLSTTLPSGLTIPGYQASITPAALTQVNDTNVTLTLGGTPATALLQATSITAGWSGTLSLARGGTAAALTATAGGIAYSTASAMAFSAAGSTGQLFISNGTSAPGWTTSTYPTTNAINTLLYASSANVISALATADSGLLVTSASGVPSISSTLPSGLTIPQPSITGVTNASNAAAGAVGEFMSSSVLNGSAIPIVSGTATNLTSITLSAGDWDVWGNVVITANAAMTEAFAWVSTSSATQPDDSLLSGPFIGVTAGMSFIAINALMQRFNVSSSTTVYISSYQSGGTSNVFSGNIFARRRR